MSQASTVATGLQRWLAVGLMLACFGMVAFAFASLVAPGRAALPGAPTPVGVVAWTLVFASFPAVGGLIALKRPRHPIGWLFLVAAVLLTASVGATEYVGRALISGWPLPAVPVVAWAGNWTYLPGTGIVLTLVPLLFPDGRFLGRGWRLLGAVASISIVVGAIAQALPSGPILGFDRPIDSPIAAPVGLADLFVLLSNLAFLVLAASGVLAMVSLGVRFRSADAIGRAQLKWFLWAVAAFILAIVVAFASQVDELFAVATGFMACIPIATGIAILRYRLFDIDRIVSRTLGWLAVTVILAAAFAGGVLVAQAVLEPVTGDSTIGVAASTLLAAALFNPVRSRVQRAVDRRFNRARYDADRLSAAFASRLRDEVDLATVSEELLVTARQALGPTAATVWVRPTVEPR